MRLIFATNNRHKLTEVGQILGDKLELVTLAECGITEDIPETSPTIEGNALQKARYVWERTHQNCFADDTGLEVEALNGAPGVRSARYATDGHDFDANVTLLLKNLEGCENPRLHGKGLTANKSGQWRYRIGDYRLLAEIEDDKIRILILNVGHRSEVYR